VTTIQSGTPINVTIVTDRANIGITPSSSAPISSVPVPTLNCQQNRRTSI